MPINKVEIEVSMRIALVAASVRPSYGGPAYSVPAIQRSLDEQGVASVLITRADGIHGAAGRVAGLRRLADVQIVHTFGIWTAFHQFACAISAAVKKPLLCSPIGMLEPWCLAHKRRRKQLALALYQRRSLKLASALHATSESEAAQLRSLGFTVPIAVVPHGVDFPLLPARVQAASATVRTALFLSRLHPKKGLRELIDAWAKLRPDGWRVVIAGPDESGHRAELEARIKAYGLSEAFSFVGHVHGERKRGLLSEADLFVLPTHSENFGNAIAEALAHGLPVLTTTAAPWGLIERARCGWWIQPGTRALTTALGCALATPSEELRAMGARGRIAVSAEHAWSLIGAKYAALYQWMLGNADPPDFVLAAPGAPLALQSTSQ